MEGRRSASIEAGKLLGKPTKMRVAQVARAAGLNRLRLAHAGFAWPWRLAT